MKTLSRSGLIAFAGLLVLGGLSFFNPTQKAPPSAALRDAAFGDAGALLNEAKSEKGKTIPGSAVADPGQAVPVKAGWIQGSLVERPVQVSGPGYSKTLSEADLIVDGTRYRLVDPNGRLVLNLLGARENMRAKEAARANIEKRDLAPDNVPSAETIEIYGELDPSEGKAYVKAVTAILRGDLTTGGRRLSKGERVYATRGSIKGSSVGIVLSKTDAEQDADSEQISVNDDAFAARAPKDLQSTYSIFPPRLVVFSVEASTFEDNWASLQPKRGIFGRFKGF